jgi:small-conductance mechanosensitive channel/CRP-like cAMP-binding protein
MIAGLVLFIATLALRSALLNRHVRARLMTSAWIAAAYAILAALIQYGRLTPELSEQLTLVLPLLVAFGVINALVALAINPWRLDRLPDRFPTIVQDAIAILLFGLTATFLLQEKIFAATAAGAVVIGLALQDTLGNLFAGLAIQMEKPFSVGHWVRIADTDGQVAHVTWRATKIRTKSGNFVVVPNSKLAGDIIVNYSEPTPESRIEVEIGASYDAFPNDVKATIIDALRDEPLISKSRAPEVLVVDFGASAMIYRIRVWTADFAADERLRDSIRTAVYYAFRRKNIEIPFPMQVEISRHDKPPLVGVGAAGEALLRVIPIFAALDDTAHAALARTATVSRYAAGDVVVYEGESGQSMFVVVRGEAVVFTGTQEIARIGAGGFFGEMSLLTGAPRNASVRVAVDSELLEITADAFREFVLANPAVVELVGTAVEKRRTELEERRAAGAVAVHAEPPQTLIDRIRRFLRA